jgi:hypothetical protein
MFYTVVLVPGLLRHPGPRSDGGVPRLHPDEPLSISRRRTDFNLTVTRVTGQRNPVTLRMEWVKDETERIPVRFFARLRVQGAGALRDRPAPDRPRDPAATGRPYFWAPTAWAATSGRA